MFLVSVKSAPDQYVSNGLSRRAVVSPSYRQFLIDRGMQHAGTDTAPAAFEFDTVSGMNAAAGLLAADSWRYNPTSAAWEPPPAPVVPPTLDQITAAFVAAVPPGSGLTSEQVTAAVQVALREGTGTGT